MQWVVVCLSKDPKSYLICNSQKEFKVTTSHETQYMCFQNWLIFLVTKILMFNCYKLLKNCYKLLKNCYKLLKNLTNEKVGKFPRLQNKLWNFKKLFLYAIYYIDILKMVFILVLFCVFETNCWVCWKLEPFQQHGMQEVKEWRKWLFMNCTDVQSLSKELGAVNIDF